MGNQQGQLPTRVQIGEQNKKQKAMNDKLQLIKEGGAQKINAIKVYFDEKYILGLVIYYKLNDGDYLKAGHNVPKEKKLLKKSNKIQSRVFEIGPDDYLLEVAGHYCPNKKNITRLNLTSYRGKIGNYGSDLGVSFCHRFQDYTFGPITSGYRDYLQFLDLPVIPAPSSFLKELNPDRVNVNISNQTSRQNKGQQIRKAQDYNNGRAGGAGNFNVENVPKPQFQGVYVTRSQPTSTYGSVTKFAMPQIQPQNSVPQQSYQQQYQFNNNNNNNMPQQQQFSYPNSQQGYQQPQQFQQMPPQNFSNQNSSNSFNNNNNMKSNYPTF